LKLGSHNLDQTGTDFGNPGDPIGVVNIQNNDENMTSDDRDDAKIFVSNLEGKAAEGGDANNMESGSGQIDETRNQSPDMVLQPTIDQNDIIQSSEAKIVSTLEPPMRRGSTITKIESSNV